MLTEFGLVVIGAHTGFHLKDLIYKYSNKKILLVEPVPYNYQALESNFGHLKNVFICKNGIIDENKTDNFFYVKKNSVISLNKHWASGIGSFDKNHILNHKNKRFKVKEDDIVKSEINFITFENLITNFSISSIDMLQIDVEGAEYKIMKSINYDMIHINKILFESKHFDGTFKEGKKLDEIKNFLISKKYTLNNIDKENILATK